MKFIAYNPLTREKIRLIPHIRILGPDKMRVYYVTVKIIMFLTRKSLKYLS